MKLESALSARVTGDGGRSARSAAPASGGVTRPSASDQPHPELVLEPGLSGHDDAVTGLDAVDRLDVVAILEQRT